MITDNFTGMKRGYAIIYKVSPTTWLNYFLDKYSPTCNKKYIHLDQGGELFNNSDVNNILQYSGYTLHPTGADTYLQNGPVKRSHSTLADSIRAMLPVINLYIIFFNICPVP